MPTSRWCLPLIPAAALALSVTTPPRAAADANQQAVPPFRSEANYVRVDVYPAKDGHPVSDLTRDDFEIVEDKVPQKIDGFEHILIRAAGPQETRREPNTVRESRDAIGDPRSRLFVVFLDVYHVDVAGSHQIRQPLIDALNRTIGEDDLVGVMTPEMSARDITFARKTTTIEGFLTRNWPWGERDQISSKDPEEDRYRHCYPGFGPTAQCKDDDRGVAVEMIYRRREKRTIDALEDLVRYLRDLREERKAIIAISDGWLLYRPDESLTRRLYCQVPGVADIHVDPRTGKLTTADTTRQGTGSMEACDRDRMNLARIDDAQEFRQILDEANRANASFYPIDPRGLAVFDTPLVDLTGPSVTPMTPPSVDARMMASRNASLRTLAEATDGAAVVQTNDLAGGLRRLLSDLTSYYLLGYYTTGKLDGKFHAIAVRVKRPGVQVRARRGYLAPTPAEATARATAATRSGDAGGSAMAAEARALATAIAPLDGLAREAPVRLQVATGWAPDHSAAFWVVGEVARRDDWMAGGDAMVMLTSAAGADVSSARVPIEPGSRSFRALLRPAAPLEPGEYEVRVRATSPTGAHSPSNDVVSVTLSRAPGTTGVLLVRRGPTTGNKEWPTADRRFRRSEILRVEVPASGAVPSARLLDRTGKALPVPVGAAVRDDADGSRWQTAQLALAPLAPGDYVVELAEPAEADSSAAGRRVLVAFRVVP